MEPLQVPDLGSRSSLRERIRDALHAALVTGGMVPGVTYSVPALAEQFGVSATPVREAMLDLAKEGMVEPVPNKGFRVVEVTDEDLDEVTELRRMLEVPAVGKLARRLGPDEIARLRALAGVIGRAATDGDLITYIDADRTFHLTLLGLAGNRRLIEIVDQLRARTRLYGLGHLVAEGSLARSASEHDELIDALEGGSSRAQVEKLVAHHIGHVRGIWASRVEDGPAARAPGAARGRRTARSSTARPSRSIT